MTLETTGQRPAQPDGPDALTDVPPGAAAPLAPVPQRSRRALLAAGLGGVAGFVAAALGRPAEARAAAGAPLIIGSETNNAGTKDTQLIANSSVVTFKLYQQGPGTALMGYATPATGQTRGVYGRVDSPSGFGIQGRNQGAAGTGAAMQAVGVNNTGLQGETTNGDRYGVEGINFTAVPGGAGAGVYGQSLLGIGVAGVSDSETGVQGISTSGFGASGASTDSYGVAAASINSYGISGFSEESVGVGGSTIGADAAGVEGTATGENGLGIAGSVSAASATAKAVYGLGSAPAYAGYFDGDVLVTGSLTAPAPTSVRIDHPSDPANRYLNHFAIASDEPLNAYAGTAVLDAEGSVTVQLPSWFELANADVRYQLTAVGAAMPDLHVAAKVDRGTFRVGGGVPGKEVSWLVTAVRADPMSRAHPRSVEERKPRGERGRFQDPALYDQPPSSAIGFETRQQIAARAASAAKGWGAAMLGKPPR